MDYKKILKKAMKDLPEDTSTKERFEIPKIRGHVQGNRTITSNFIQIASVLRRKPEHLLKYVLTGLATSGEIKKNGSVIIKGKVSASRLNEKIREYSHEFVFCPECGKPDTKLEKEGKFTFIKCLACGAKNYAKSNI